MGKIALGPTGRSTGLIDSYIKNNLDRDYLIELYFVRGKWEVFCWKVELGPDGELPPYESLEHHWDISGRVIGYKHCDPNRQITEPFTEQTAREEFERWRA